MDDVIFISDQVARVSRHNNLAMPVEHISASETIYPGEFLGSGTVGKGCGLEQMRFLKPGDVVELEV